MKKLNNKGYLTVEVVLASVIAFGLAYFLLNLTIKVKDKNDDMLVKTILINDKAIIENNIMKDNDKGVPIGRKYNEKFKTQYNKYVKKRV